MPSDTRFKIGWPWQLCSCWPSASRTATTSSSSPTTSPVVDSRRPRAGRLAVDGLLVMATAALRWLLHRPADPKAFTKRLLTGRWGRGRTGCADAPVLGLYSRMASELEPRRFGDDQFVGECVVRRRDDAVAAVRAERRGRPHNAGWVTPIVLGTLGAQLASALWYPAIERHENCAGEISAWYFSNMSYMFALILLTLCVELNFLRRNPMDRDAGQRVAPLFTVIMISPQHAPVIHGAGEGGHAAMRDRRGVARVLHLRVHRPGIDHRAGHSGVVVDPWRGSIRTLRECTRVRSP